MRTLEWKHNLGMVELELELAGKTLTFSVTPPRATAIYHFQEKSGYTWTLVWGGVHAVTVSYQAELSRPWPLGKCV